MGELTAEMVEQGRGRSPGRERRRRLAQDMRTAREKLTSSTGLQRAFDYEFLRVYAEQHRRSSLVVLGIAAAIATVSSTWLPAPMAAAWFAFMSAAIGIQHSLSRGFAEADPTIVSLGTWRRRFALSDLLLGAIWAAAFKELAEVPGGTYGFALFMGVMVAATTAVLSAAIPIAVYAGITPLALVALGLLGLTRDFGSAILAVMTSAALVCFIFLGHRLYDSTLSSLRWRAERDQMLVELEEAKANSDEARRRAEEANLAKSRFLATMSHELRTPLNAIMGFSEVMKNEVFGPHSNPAYREYSGDVHESGQHLLTLINEILDLSRIEAGRYDLSEEAIQLSWAVSEASHMVAMRAKAKGQIIRDLIDPSLPRLWADERAVRQIVLNILSNAIKFTPPGGEIEIKVGWTASGGQYVSVKDSGPGIPEDEIPIVMSSFGRGSLAIKTAEQGSGLGLPIVKGLIDLHGGGFQIRSRAREGTEVIVTFPSARVIDALPAVDIPRGPPAQAA
ncbi:sensor histidine kinase [Enterovirga rhinocerotis]|uniref:histidine kinase n=1 Tax=Enterovirga rhinocerotis TaxID=1339210 RepID=A0A4R7BWQ4_9HYPH|nr:HAMP domain-containing sensor histidine kinase [Enterovirga rhinocerotis]TDR89933.1 two-component system cell cycle sensor histidine kinase PleC [Enterovirga rhinocerotis]